MYFLYTTNTSAEMNKAYKILPAKLRACKTNTKYTQKMLKVMQKFAKMHNKKAKPFFKTREKKQNLHSVRSVHLFPSLIICNFLYITITCIFVHDQYLYFQYMTITSIICPITCLSSLARASPGLLGSMSSSNLTCFLSSSCPHNMSLFCFLFLLHMGLYFFCKFLEIIFIASSVDEQLKQFIELCLQQTTRSNG